MVSNPAPAVQSPPENSPSELALFNASRRVHSPSVAVVSDVVVTSMTAAVASDAMSEDPRAMAAPVASASTALFFLLDFFAAICILLNDRGTASGQGHRGFCSGNCLLEPL